MRGATHAPADRHPLELAPAKAPRELSPEFAADQATQENISAVGDTPAFEDQVRRPQVAHSASSSTAKSAAMKDPGVPGNSRCIEPLGLLAYPSGRTAHAKIRIRATTSEDGLARQFAGLGGRRLRLAWREMIGSDKPLASAFVTQRIKSGRPYPRGSPGVCSFL